MPLQEKSLKEKLSGVFPPVMTPFFADGRIDYAGLALNIEKMNRTDLGGYMPLGSNGEFRSLTDGEALEVVRLIAKKRGPGKTLMVGTGRESAWATIEFTKKAAGAGAEFASLLTPYYYASKMTDAALTRFFAQVADASPIPVLIYCAPGFAGGLVISPGAVRELAAHPNIVGMKDTSKEDIGGYVRAAEGAEFYVLAGSISKFYYGLSVGAIGGVLSIANYLPQECCEIQRLFSVGKKEEANALSEVLKSITSRATGKYGVAGVKGAMELLGYRGGEPRVPLLPLGPAELEEVRGVLASEGFLKQP
ncbi:MAG: dihydrodipicolinate synthase family protein [Spirochaetia bacterium]|jgi:4-hydroxy-2-oxoglutarate aldolase|nr:dihydrodipicolinate synthase family protein [Spirochaetia bacterium]